MAARNGIVDLDRFAAGDPQAVAPPSPLYFTEAAVDYDVTPGGGEPVVWLRFLDSVWGDDPESVSALQEWLGYLPTADTRQQKALMLIGPKRSGKGTIIRLVREVVGRANCCPTDFKTLGGDFGLWSLLGKTVATVGEAQLGGRGDVETAVARVLFVTGGDAQIVNRKNKEMVQADLSVRFVLAANEVPQVDNAAEVFASRFILLRTTKSHQDKENIDLDELLEKELPSIFRWAVQGLARLRQRGRFVQPSTGKVLLGTMREASSPVGLFVAEECVDDSAGRVGKDELYDRYRQWCTKSGEKPLSKAHFGAKLHACVPRLKTERVSVPGKGRRWVYAGIRPKSYLESTFGDEHEDEPSALGVQDVQAGPGSEPGTRTDETPYDSSVSDACPGCPGDFTEADPRTESVGGAVIGNGLDSLDTVPAEPADSSLGVHVDDYEFEWTLAGLSELRECPTANPDVQDGGYRLRMALIRRAWPQRAASYSEGRQDGSHDPGDDHRGEADDPIPF